MGVVSIEDGVSPRIISENDRIIHAAMISEMTKTGYAGRFKARPLDASTDPLGVLRTDKPHIPAAAFDIKKFQHITALLDVVVKREDRLRLVEAFLDIHCRYSEFLQKGGNIAYLTNHRSYIDGILVPHSQTEADLIVRGHKEKTPEINSRHIISGRQVGMFEMDGLKPDGSPGYIIDDVVHHISSVLQTLPAHHAMQVLESGEKVDLLPPGLREQINLAFFERYLQLLQIGGQTIVLAGSGDEDTEVPGQGTIMKRVEKPTTRLLSVPNFKEIGVNDERWPGGKRKLFRPCDDEELWNRPGSLLTIPLFIDCMPWNRGGELIGSAGISFIFGTPFFAKKPGDTHRAMEELAQLGTRASLPDTLSPIVYGNTILQLGNGAAKAASLIRPR